MKDNKRPGQNLRGLSVQQLLGVSGEESAMDIELELIHPFNNHPFKVIDDEKMQDLVESIRVNGVLTPVLLREIQHGQYEMISGHRRKFAAELAGLKTIPAIIREMTDDEAVITMVDANIQREELLPSERAFAFKMKMDAMRHQGTSRHDVEKLSCDVVGEGSGLGGRQVLRYIRLTELVPELLNLVDEKRLQMGLAVEISRIDKQVQSWIYEYIHQTGDVKAAQIEALRKKLEEGSLDKTQVNAILNENRVEKVTPVKLTFTEKRLRKYFPAAYTQQEMENVIESLLKQWSEAQGAN